MRLLRRPRPTHLAALAGAGTLVSLAVAAALASAAGKPPPPKAQWPPGAVDIATVSNGCGPGDATRDPNWSGQDSQTYERADGQTVVVSFRDACDLHDAAYSGALVWDRIEGRFVDFSEPRWTKQAINEKFRRDLQRHCFQQIPQQPVWEDVTLMCLTRDAVASETWGALSYYRIVTNRFAKNPRERIKLTGQWKNRNPGFPPCDVGANRWTIRQAGRSVTAQWEHGTSGDAQGRFEGTFITGDRVGDDRVEGTYTILDGGRVVAKGTMTFAVRSDRSFDFKGSGPVGAGTMLVVERETQGAATKCKARPRAKPKRPAPQAGSYVLVPGLTEVKNPSAPEVTVDAAGGKTVWDHTGQFGGAGKGGEWKVEFTFAVPRTFTPGKSSSLKVGMTISNVQPEQPLLIAMGIRAPDFVQQFALQYPDAASGSKTYSIPLSASYTGKELLVFVNTGSAEVIYHYRR
jgi:hypothetical protein